MLKVDAPYSNSRIGTMFILYQEFMYIMHIEDLIYVMKVKSIVFKIILFTFGLQLNYSILKFLKRTIAKKNKR